MFLKKFIALKIGLYDGKTAEAEVGVTVVIKVGIEDGFDVGGKVGK
jgi:hypothetical protein